MNDVAGITGRPLRLAVLILGFRGATVLRHTVPVYRAAGWDVFVHVDLKAGLAAYQDAMGPAAGECTFVERMECYWCGYTSVEAELRLAETARAAADYDRFMLLSDDSLPVMPPAVMNAALGAPRDGITAIQQPEGTVNHTRYHQYFLNDHPATMLRDHGSRSTELDDAFFAAAADMMDLRRTGKKRMTLAYGSQFWCLSRETMAFVQRTVATDSHLVRSFRYSPLSDETMIQSIARQHLLERDVDFQPVYADFHSQTGGPRVLDSIAGLPFDLHPWQVLVRKARPGADDFAAAVAGRLLAGRTAWGLAPSATGFSAEVIREDGTPLPIATVRLTAPGPDAEPGGWHGLETYLDRTYRWTGARHVAFQATPQDLPAGMIRFVVPAVLGKPASIDGSALLLNGVRAPLRHTRHNLIAEIAHDGLPAGTPVVLETPPLEPGGPADPRSLGIGIAIA